MADKFRLPSRYGEGEKSVWVEYIELASEYKPAVNLGQGFPDYHAPKHVTQALANITVGDNPLLNQYTRGFGHPRLVQNLTKLYSPLIGREIDPNNEILVTSGAYEALFSAILGHVESGDEVILIEPFFDCYEFMIKSACGTPKFIALTPGIDDNHLMQHAAATIMQTLATRLMETGSTRDILRPDWPRSSRSAENIAAADANVQADTNISTIQSNFKFPKSKKTSGDISSADWVLDYKELASMFSSRTKMIILNTPHNPLGKVFCKEELENIADLCKKHNVLCLSDEVYEWMVYEPMTHIRIATFPGMWERTITIGSAGKTFSVTGWKTGWAYGPANLMRNLQIVHQNCSCTPVQEAIARSIEYERARYDSPDCYFVSLARELQPKRDHLIRTLRETGFNPTVPEAGYFIIADWTNLANKIDLSSETDKYKDYKFTKKLAKEAGVLALPPSAFYSANHKNLGENFVRFCFIKKDEILELTEKLLKEWNS